MKSRIQAFLYRLIACLAFMIFAANAQAATTILPQGWTCFSNANGPIISGSVNMFYPATTTPKPNWQDSGQVTQNSNPIQLDANGCAIIYGVGQYRQQVYTGPVVGGLPTGNLFFDALTTDTSAFNSTFWASLSAGTPNTITVVDTGFNGTDGTVIQFVALATNTGATTLNPSGFGAVSIVKDTTGGPVALTGGEIVASNVISVVYYATSNTFHLLNAVIASASGASSPLCGASRLLIANNSSTPNSIVAVSATQVVTQSAAGLVLNRSSVSFNINLSTGNATSTANGMDGEAIGTSQWLFIYIIDNGVAAAGLASTSSTGPTLPSGYTYKCRVGAVAVDNTGVLYRTRQSGSNANYVITTTTNTADFTATPLNIVNGISGSTYSTTTPTLVAVTVTGNAKCAPPTASAVRIIADNGWQANAGSGVLAAPSTAYGGTNRGPQGSVGMYYPINVVSGSSGTSAWITLEASTIGYAASQAGGGLGCGGWKDAVNAN